MSEVVYARSPSVTNDALNALCANAWPEHTNRNFAEVLQHSLAYICAFSHDQLIGFVNVAWDGGQHAFLLDPTVHPEFHRRGIGLELVRQAAEAAAGRGVEWLHVDYVPELRPFYEKAAFRPTTAGLRRLCP